MRSILLLFAGLAAGCGANSSTGVQTAQPAVTDTIRIATFAFAPAQLTVARGTTLIWSNTDPTIHTVSADNGTFDSGAFGEAKTFRFVVNAEGTYAYFCRIHPYMRATIVVTR